jgi:hypothetical protein
VPRPVGVLVGATNTPKTSAITAVPPVTAITAVPPITAVAALPEDVSAAAALPTSTTVAALPEEDSAVLARLLRFRGESPRHKRRRSRIIANDGKRPNPDSSDEQRRDDRQRRLLPHAAPLAAIS